MDAPLACSFEDPFDGARARQAAAVTAAAAAAVAARASSSASGPSSSQDTPPHAAGRATPRRAGRGGPTAGPIAADGSARRPPGLCMPDETSSRSISNIDRKRSGSSKYVCSIFWMFDWVSRIESIVKGPAFSRTVAKWRHAATNFDTSTSRSSSKHSAKSCAESRQEAPSLRARARNRRERCRPVRALLRCVDDRVGCWTRQVLRASLLRYSLHVTYLSQDADAAALGA